MDTQKIGKFLKQLRKEQNLTQEQLGEKVGVTNKTVSRWETGEYMPPVECLKLLSDIYQISINEILAGERLTQENFAEAADENLTDTLEMYEAKGKKAQRILSGMMIATTVLAIAIMNLLPMDNLTGEELLRNIAVVVLVCAMAFISNTLNIVAMLLMKERGK